LEDKSKWSLYHEDIHSIRKSDFDNKYVRSSSSNCNEEDNIHHRPRFQSKNSICLIIEYEYLGRKITHGWQIWKEL
jgi:hypothetical protein